MANLIKKYGVIKITELGEYNNNFYSHDILFQSNNKKSCENYINKHRLKKTEIMTIRQLELSQESLNR